jgi:transcriptional regulator with XRE-family HTH domain
MSPLQAGQILLRLDNRRRKLRMSYAHLAKRCGVSVPTLARTLSGKNTNASFTSVLAIAETLGVAVDFKEETAAYSVLEDAAERKATKIVSMVQATSGLEAQAVDPDEIESMKRQTVHELLSSGSGRKIWG